MTIAGLHYDKFKEQVVAEGRVFTFTDGTDYLVFKTAHHEVIPFWSSRTRAERVRRAHAKYRTLMLKEITLAAFLELLPQLEAEEVRIGTNWSGERLVGYDVDGAELARALDYWIGRQGKRAIPSRRTRSRR